MDSPADAVANFYAVFNQRYCYDLGATMPVFSVGSFDEVFAQTLGIQSATDVSSFLPTCWLFYSTRAGRQQLSRICLFL